MKPILIATITMLSCTLTAPISLAQSSTGLKLCANSRSSALTSRTQCRKGEVALTMKSLSEKITKEQGGAGSEFSVVLGDGSSSNSTIPGATTLPGWPPTTIPGSLSKSASCVTGIVHASSCESSDLTSLTVSAQPSASGTSVQCSWSNSALQDKVGLYYVKLVCADL